MRHKRGQLSLFIAVGVLLIVGLGIFLYIKSLSAQKHAEVPADIAPIKLYIDKCLEETAKDAVLLVALQGGYYFAPEDSLGFLNVEIPYYMYEGNVSIPTKKEIENELSLYMVLNLPQCANLDTFREKGYDIEAGDMTPKATIGSKEVLFDVDWPITLKLEGQEQKIGKFSTGVDAKLMGLYGAANQYMQYQTKDTTSLFISRLMDITENNDLTFEVFTFEGASIISLIDNKTLIKNQPLIFAFGIKYSAPQASETVYIEPLIEKTAFVGEVFDYNLTAIGTNLKYNADTDLFNITKGGAISFIPAENQIGKYSIHITVINDLGNTAYSTLDLEIMNKSNG